MKRLVGSLLALALVLSSTVAGAAVISSFQATYDTTNNRIEYSFDLDPVDATTPSGVDQIYFNYDPQSPPNPFNGTPSTLLDSSVAGTTVSIFDVDEITFIFPSPLTTATSITFIVGDADATSVVSAGAYSLELYVNPGFISSSLIQQNMGILETDADTIVGLVPPSITAAAAAAPPTAIPSVPFYGLLMLATGLACLGRRRLGQAAA